MQWPRELAKTHGETSASENECWGLIPTKHLNKFTKNSRECEKT